MFSKTFFSQNLDGEKVVWWVACNKTSSLPIRVIVLEMIIPGFVLSTHYRTNALLLLCACDAFHFVSDSTQFYAANGHTYFS